jgi:hypothetical protein
VAGRGRRRDGGHPGEDDGGQPEVRPAQRGRGPNTSRATASSSTPIVTPEADM